MDLGPRADRGEYELRSGGPANATKQLSPRRGRLLPLYAGDESGTPLPPPREAEDQVSCGSVPLSGAIIEPDDSVSAWKGKFELDASASC